jgi:hypothetical protein
MRIASRNGRKGRNGFAGNQNLSGLGVLRVMFS